MALSDARKTLISQQTINGNATLVNALGTHTFGYGTSLPRTDSLAGPNGVTSTFACHANTAPGDGAQALAGIAHVRGAAQQARHVDGDDKAGRFTGWEQKGIGLNTAKTAYLKIGNGRQRNGDRGIGMQAFRTLDVSPAG